MTFNSFAEEGEICLPDQRAAAVPDGPGCVVSMFVARRRRCG